MATVLKRPKPPKKRINISYATPSRGIPWNIPRVTCIFLLYILAFYYFMSRHRKYSGQHNQCDLRAVHDGKVGCNTADYNGFPVFWQAVFFIAWYKHLYISGFCYIIMVNSTRFYIWTFQYVNHSTGKNTVQGSRLTFQLASPVASDRFDSLAKTNFSLARFSKMHHRIKSSKC